MKIKTKPMDYDAVMALPRPAHKPPRRPDALLRALIRALSAGDLRKTHFSYTSERMEALGPGPYLIVMNHSSFIDLEIAAHIFRSEPYCIVCTSDGFVGKEALMRRIGCIPTNKFVTDLGLMADMAHALLTGRRYRANSDMTLHVLEIMEGFITAGAEKRFVTIESRFEPTPQMARAGIHGLLDD